VPCPKLEVLVVTVVARSTLLFNVDHHCILRCSQEISSRSGQLRVKKNGDVEAACAAEEAFNEALITEDSP
jgi:hypothetical protein